jgi:CRAL/TRIO domain
VPSVLIGSSPLTISVPWYITAFFKMISPFIDPHTRTKMIFNEPIANYIPAEQLLIPFGGSLEFEYDHDVYWPALDKLCTTRRRDYHERWVRAGKQIGEHEAYLRGGEAKSLNGELLGSNFEEGFAEKGQSA